VPFQRKKAMNVARSLRKSSGGRLWFGCAICEEAGEEACETVSVKNTGSVISLSGTTPDAGGSNGGNMDAVGSAVCDDDWDEFGDFGNGWQSASVDPLNAGSFLDGLPFPSLVGAGGVASTNLGGYVLASPAQAAVGATVLSSSGTLAQSTSTATASSQSALSLPPPTININIVDIIPKADSAEADQNSEPSLAVDPLDPNKIIAAAFGSTFYNNLTPYFVSSDGGNAWSRFGALNAFDKSIAWNTDGSRGTHGDARRVIT